MVLTSWKTLSLYLTIWFVGRWPLAVCSVQQVKDCWFASRYLSTDTWVMRLIKIRASCRAAVVVMNRVHVAFCRQLFILHYNIWRPWSEMINGKRNLFKTMWLTIASNKIQNVFGSNCKRQNFDRVNSPYPTYVQHNLLR